MAHKKYLFTIVIIIFFFMPNTVLAAPIISSLSDNLSQQNNQLPTYEKLEISFQTSLPTNANPYIPFILLNQANQYLKNYENKGVSVDGIFTDPQGNVFKQPGFYFQNFTPGTKDNFIWVHPTDQYTWKIRFAPNKAGNWKYKVRIQNSEGVTESSEKTFTVIPSSNPGFINVSTNDSRYFEFDNGTYFPALGYNLALGELENPQTMTALNQNDIRLIRTWISPSSIFATSWSHWRTMPVHYDAYLPRVPIVNASFDGQPNRFYYYIREQSTWYEPCMFVGHEQLSAAIKPQTNYYVSIRFQAIDITGPRVASAPYGFTAVIGGWNENCAEPNVGQPLTNPTHFKNTTGFQTTNFVWNSGNNNFLPIFALVLQNANDGKVYIEQVSIREMTGGTVSNPVLTNAEILDKPDPNQQLYMAQRNSYRLDTIIENAKANNIYIRPVIHEKQEDIFLSLDHYGNPGAANSGQDRFYGNERALTAPRWLQQAWWRYLQARWGYSTQIHSWELLNEGDPFHAGHYTLADELAIYMKCRAFGIEIPYQHGAKCNYNHPNAHLSSTSFWHSLPLTEFWKNSAYPNSDFVDIHAYISTSYAPSSEKNIMQYDSAHYHLWHTQDIYSKNIGKPVIRGEAGLDTPTQQNPNLLGLNQDTQGVWLHSYLWSSLHPGGLIESYWWVREHMPVGIRTKYKHFSQFIKTIPLNNGNYKELSVTIGNSNLRVVGQKDQVHHNAHLWVQNKQYTWKNVVDNVSITPISSTVAINGFEPNKNYTLQTWDTYTAQFTSSTVLSSNTGVITIPITNLQKDIAFKILNPSAVTPTQPPTLTPTSSVPQQPCTKQGDTNRPSGGCDNVINVLDYSYLSSKFGTNDPGADLKPDGSINVLDYTVLSNNFGK